LEQKVKKGRKSVAASYQVQPKRSRNQKRGLKKERSGAWERKTSTQGTKERGNQAPTKNEPAHKGGEKGGSLIGCTLGTHGVKKKKEAMKSLVLRRTDEREGKVLTGESARWEGYFSHSPRNNGLKKKCTLVLRMGKPLR